MTANYYTLNALIRELAPQLVGACFAEAYSHRPNELRIMFDRGTLVAVLRPIDGALFFSDRPEQRPRTNIQSFFTSLAGQPLTAMRISDADREVALVFPGTEIIVTFFGSPNALLVRDGEVVESFKRRQPTVSSSKAGGSKLGKRYLAEAAAREIPEQDIENELLTAKGAMVYDRGDTVLLSLIPLTAAQGASVRHFDSVNDAVRYAIVERGKRQRVASLRKELISAVERELEQLERSRSEMRKGSEDSFRAERYTALANTLLMHAHEIEKGAEEVMLEVGEQATRVKLDPTLSAYENASRYFERAKRAKESKAELKDRAVSIAAEIVRLSERREAILHAVTFDELLELKRPAKAKADAPVSKFREYRVAGGMLVMVGRNAKQNDELTLHTAKKDDVWLHARGVPGSHVVLQVAGRKQVPKEAIVQAAEIAAYHSDAKSQTLAPVSYTQKKYVRKPKGADPGAVIVEREEVVMVTPRTPSQ